MPFTVLDKETSRVKIYGSISAIAEKENINADHLYSVFSAQKKTIHNYNKDNKRLVIEKSNMIRTKNKKTREREMNTQCSFLLFNFFEDFNEDFKKDD